MSILKQIQNYNIKMQEQIQLEISINIKNKKYLIRVPKNADISALVHQFLIDNQLNTKHEKAILQILQQKLQQVQQQNTQKKYKMGAEVQEKYSPILAVQQLEREVEKKVEAIANQTVSYNKKMGLITKIKQQLQQNQRQQGNQPPPQSRKVYQQWKLKEKEKTKRQSKPDKSCENSRITTKKQTISPDYFYKKGLKFKEQCEKNSQNEFKKLYPFKLHDKELTQHEQQKLCQRLSKERKDFHVREYLSRRAQDENIKMMTKNDVIKQRIRQQDQEVDKALFEMIRNGEVSSNKIRPSSRSPFRKTIFR